MKKQERLAKDKVEDDGYIAFYGVQNEKYGMFSNFSPHGIWLPCPHDHSQMKWYPSTEHRFAAMKTITMSDHEWVRKSANAMQAKDRGRHVDLREGWGNDYGDLCWFAMFEAVLAKAIQWPEMGKLLDSTLGKYIYEDSPVDDIWGWRYREDYRGKNLLGHALMNARDILLHPSSEVPV